MDAEEINFHSRAFGYRPPMHILIIHQAFASLNEPGGTRHHEFARLLTTRGHKVTVIASPVSYITGAPSQPPLFSPKMGGAGRWLP